MEKICFEENEENLVGHFLVECMSKVDPTLKCFAAGAKNNVFNPNELEVHLTVNGVCLSFKDIILGMEKHIDEYEDTVRRKYSKILIKQLLSEMLQSMETEVADNLSKEISRYSVEKN